jgi:hypothetical protein
MAFDAAMVTCLASNLRGTKGNTAGTMGRAMGVWQGLAKDSLKYQLGPPCFTLLDVSTVSGVACPQGGWLAAIFYPFGHPALYG